MYQLGQRVICKSSLSGYHSIKKASTPCERSSNDTEYKEYEFVIAGKLKFAHSTKYKYLLMPPENLLVGWMLDGSHNLAKDYAGEMMFVHDIRLVGCQEENIIRALNFNLIKTKCSECKR